MCPTCLAHPFPGFPHCLHLSPHPSIVEEVGTSRLAKQMVLRLYHKTNLCQISGRDPILPHLVPFPRLFHTSGTHLAITSPPPCSPAPRSPTAGAIVPLHLEGPFPLLLRARDIQLLSLDPSLLGHLFKGDIHYLLRCSLVYRGLASIVASILPESGLFFF